MEGGGKTIPLVTAINQLTRANQYFPPSLAGWQHSGVIKIVTIGKSRWIEHLLPVLLSSESDYLCVADAQKGNKSKSLHVYANDCSIHECVLCAGTATN